MKFEFEYNETGFSTFVVDGVRIHPEVISGLIHPRTDIWWRVKREGDVVIVEQKHDEPSKVLEFVESK
jgi:hypothetical protein